MLVALSELCDDLLVPLKLAAWVLHGVEDEDPIWYVVILVRCEPVGKDCIGCPRLLPSKFLHSDARTLQSSLEIVKLLLGLEH